MTETRSPVGGLFVETEKEVRRLFQELIHQTWGYGGLPETHAWQPCMDMWETNDALIIEIELPGMRRKDVTVEVEGNQLRITGERRATVTIASDIITRSNAPQGSLDGSYGCRVALIERRFRRGFVRVS